MFFSPHKKKYPLLIIILLVVSSVFSQTNSNISGIVNAYTPVTLISSCSIDVIDVSAFSIGKRVMIIQMRGADMDTSNTANFGDLLNLNNCGNYEFSHVSAIVGNTIFLTDTLQRDYDVTGAVQLILVSKSPSITISGPLTCPTWNGSSGGVIVIECSGTLTLNANIDAKSKGFILGNVSPTGYNCPGSFDYYFPSTSYFGGEKGEGISNISSSKHNGMGKLVNGGGGGNNVNAGGGGGGNFGNGGNGGFSYEGCPIMDIGGRGGQALSYSNLINKIFLGGGGGGGHQNDLQATPGTNGGGIVILRANTIIGNGNSINASAFDVLPGGCDGTGGGGGGGTVLMDVDNFTGALNVNVKGGDGAFPTCYLQGASGGGGGGCVWSKLALPANVSTNVNGGIRGIHGSGSQDGLSGDTLSGLTIIGSPFIFNPFNYPIAVSSLNNTICFGNNTSLSVAPNGIGFTYDWSPVISLNNSIIYNPSATPTAATTYSVILNYPNGCRVSDSVMVSVNPKPVADFNNTTVCKSNVTQFYDSSTTAFGTVSTWDWDFGDSSPINNIASPSHLYASAGSYIVTLVVNNSLNCSDTIIKTVMVFYNPTASFTSNNVCLGDTINFTNASVVDASTSIASNLWVFGDSSPSSNLQNPNHKYFNSGTYNVTLVITSADGCSDVNNSIVKVFDTPISGMTFSNTCLFDSASFTNTSVSPSMGSIANWSWDFGDGSLIDTATFNTVHLYAAPGNYILSLITKSSNLGCADTLKDTITVFPMPIANIANTAVCLNDGMNFNDLSIVSGGSITGWSWDFSDGTSPNGNPNPSHIYSNPGTYTVTLIVTTNNSCKDTITKSAVVHPLPSAQFSADNVCDGALVQFNNFSSIQASDTIQSCTWNFDDGSPIDTIQNLSHLYPAAGTYFVQLLIISTFGCLDSTSNTIIVNPNPVVNFTTNKDAGCEPLFVSFQNSSSILTGNNTMSVWDFGDGSIASDSNHLYDNTSNFLPEFFNINLTVTSDSGCVSTLTKNNFITVYPIPNAAFTVMPQIATITNPVISIKNLSIGANFWTWNFGDSDTSQVINPIPHTYADTGTYYITLITGNQYGCFDSALQTIVIEPDFMVYIPNAFTPNNDDVNDFFTAKGEFIEYFEMSIFDRWGNLIFFSDNINKPWNGKANRGNEISQDDVYIYSIMINDFKKTKHKYKGIVTLLK